MERYRHIADGRDCTFVQVRNVELETAEIVVTWDDTGQNSDWLTAKGNFIRIDYTPTQG